MEVGYIEVEDEIWGWKTKYRGGKQNVEVENEI